MKRFSASATLHLIVICIASVLLFSGCMQEKKYAGPMLDTGASDRDKLLMIRHLPLGLPFEEVRVRFSVITPLGPEGGMSGSSEHRLEEARTTLKVLNHETTLELNFENNRLYGFVFSVAGLDSLRADLLRSELQRFYTMEFGNYHQEFQSEGSYRSETSIWTTPDTEVGLTLSVSSGEFLVTWGFQPLVNRSAPLAGCLGSTSRRSRHG